MIKKWSYVVATVATVLGGTILTGCIDNDEPFGITQIRVETANLLKAKQALVAADAAAKQAKAELDKANAEIAKINAEIAKAQAESAIRIAELQAEAAAAKTQAEAAFAQAQADQLKAQIEAYIADQKAKLDYLIADNELKIKNSQLMYDELLYQWELSKLNIANGVSGGLYQSVQLAYTNYIEELAAYNAKAEELTKKQRESAQWLNDLVYDEKAGKWTHPKDKYKKMLETEIAQEEKNIANAQAAITSYNNQISEFEDVKTNNDIYAMWENYSKKVEENKAQIAELQVAESNITLANQPLHNQVSALWDAYLAVGNKEIEIPAYTFKPSAELAALGMTEDQVIVPEGETYTLNERSNYDNYVNAYQNAIYSRKHYLMDENDVLWTTACVNEMTRQMESLQAVYDAANAEWENAKAVYNMGNEVKASELPLETEVEKVVNDYNAIEAEIAPIKDKIVEATEKYNEANNNYWNAYNAKYYNGEILNQDWKEANEAYNKAYSDAWATYWDANDEARTVRDQAIQNAQKERNNKWSAYWRAVDEYNALLNQSNLDPDNATLKAQLKAAETAMNAAHQTALKADSDYSTAEAAAYDKCNLAIAAAGTARVKALNQAEADREKAETAWIASGGDDAELKALEKVMNDASAALTELQESLDPLKDQMYELRDAVSEAVTNQRNEIGMSYWNGPNSAPWDYLIDNYINSIKYNWSGYDFPVASVPILYEDGNGVYLNAKNYLIVKSRIAYGSLGYDYYSDEYNGESHNGWISDLEYDRAFLVEEVTVDMLNAYVKSYCKKNYGRELQDYQCYWYYSSLFGDYGQLEYLKNRIAVANATIANSELSTTAVADLEANLEALINSAEPVEQEMAKAYETYEAKSEEYNQLYVDVRDQMSDLIYDNYLMNNVLQVINNNFELLNDVDKVKPEDIQAAIDALQKNISAEESNIAIAEKALNEAKNNLTLLENGNAEYDYNPYTAQIELLTAQLEVSKDRLDLIKARLDELQSKYEAAAKQ